MPPAQTAAAIAWADGAITDALATLLHFEDSPAVRVRISEACVFLRFGFVRGAQQCVPSFAATFVSVWPACCAICPALAAAPIVASSPLPTIAAFHSAWTLLQALLASVRARFAALDRDTRVWVDGSTHSAFHPSIPRDFVLPEPADLFGGAERTSIYRCTQSAVYLGCHQLRCMAPRQGGVRDVRRRVCRRRRRARS